MVDETQSSFVPGRHAVDNAIILQEIIHSMQYLKGSKGFMIIKLDLAKAYDRMEWPFIINILHDLGVPPNAVELISACISSPTMSINWQGQNTTSFSPTRGLRQGDPISPYLFVLGMERFGHCIRDSLECGTWVPFACVGLSCHTCFLLMT